jgi:hypothetical protein
VNIAEIKAYQEKVNAQLHETKAVLDGIEAHAQGKLAQSEIDTIARLKAKSHEIHDKVHKDLKVAGGAVLAAKAKSDFDAEVTKFKAAVNELSAKSKSVAKAS